MRQKLSKPIFCCYTSRVNIWVQIRGWQCVCVFMTLDIFVYRIQEIRIYLCVQDEEVRMIRESWVNPFFLVIQVEYIQWVQIRVWQSMYVFVTIDIFFPKLTKIFLCICIHRMRRCGECAKSWVKRVCRTNRLLLFAVLG